ncbi:MAG: Glycosyl transferase group 1 [Microgenomates group bacterium GW2011_GWA1_Microgenomates_45_10]|nr:MAG: Glycosyl transferase group 1 [Microgenomates group bacterium GW2011_GWB1_44_8]KKT87114.1 MAG: Glycosyl transferase group 1 [Microgenomates group bacterium GW2011_GWA1_Microgenomates_45_10]
MTALHPKIALVHDYVKEFGGAERVLLILSEMFPHAPVYTAFSVPGSTFAKALSGKKVVTSWANFFLRWGNLHSPFRFLIPLLWPSFDFRAFDIVISSASGYMPEGISVSPKTLHLCYCHTPPRWLYNYSTSIGFKKYLPVKIYGILVGHFLRIFDFQWAQKVDLFIANSKNVQARINKFYRRSSSVIYPPVEVNGIKQATIGLKPDNFYLIVSRIVGGKGLELAVKAASLTGVPLKIIGERFGLSTEFENLQRISGGNVQFLGRLPDTQMWNYLGRCKAFLALATDEDFGVTPVEAMAAGRPVIAFAGGGYLETVVDGKTGVFFKENSVDSLISAMKRLDKLAIKPQDCRQQAMRFSKERFIKEMDHFVKNSWRTFHAGTS